MRSEMPASRNDLARHVNKTYKARYDRIVGTDTVEGNLLAPALAGLLVRTGQDEKLTNQMVELGSQYMGLSGDADKTKLAPNMLGLALRETMRKVGEPAYEPLLDMAVNGSSLEKGAAAGALAATEDETVYKMLLADVVLSEDSPLTGRQSGTVLNGLLGSDTFGDQTWDWFKANLPAYVNKVPDVRKGRLPAAGGNFCSLDRRDELRTFIEANAELMPGYERSLLQTLEGIELCAALKEAKADELAAALRKR
jgi:alanyl aminopeptidase